MNDPGSSHLRQLDLNLPHRTALGHDVFETADCNALAVGWVNCWPDWPNRGLVIHGPEGSGKSHLAAMWRAQSDAVMLNDGALDIESGRAMAEQGRALLLEDADTRLAAVSAWQETLFHLYNAVRLAGGSLLLTARTPPALWRVDLPDLRSRIKALPAVAIELPDDVLLEKVMRKQFRDRQLDVQSDVVSFVLPRIERSFSAIREFVDRIDEVSLERRRNVTRPLARELLSGPAIRHGARGWPEGEDHGSGD